MIWLWRRFFVLLTTSPIGYTLYLSSYLTIGWPSKHFNSILCRSISSFLLCHKEILMSKIKEIIIISLLGKIGKKLFLQYWHIFESMFPLIPPVLVNHCFKLLSRPSKNSCHVSRWTVVFRDKVLISEFPDWHSIAVRKYSKSDLIREYDDIIDSP